MSARVSPRAAAMRQLHDLRRAGLAIVAGPSVNDPAVIARIQDEQRREREAMARDPFSRVTRRAQAEAQEARTTPWSTNPVLRPAMDAAAEALEREHPHDPGSEPCCLADREE